MLAQPLTRSALSAFLLAGLAANALAAPPAVLDRVPENAHVVVAIQQVNDFLADLDQINRLLGPNSNPGLVFATSMVRGMPGMNLDGNAALVITLPADPAWGAVPALAVLPAACVSPTPLPRDPWDVPFHGWLDETGVHHAADPGPAAVNFVATS